MLQKYDKPKSSLLLALAAAGGFAISGPASAAVATCSLDDGYAKSLTSYVAEANACIETAENIDAKMADGLVSKINAERTTLGLSPLTRRASLDMAAQAHALDMATRIFADHVDLEGRDHLHRIRAFDRTMLVGASGSNVTVSLAAGDLDAVHAKLKRDQLNADNMVRRGFTDVGVGVVEKAGQYYVVQVFAAAEGDFLSAIPVTANGSRSLKANLTDRGRQVVAWGLVDNVSGDTLARSTMPRVRFSSLRGAESAALNVLVAERGDTYVLKGPLVSSR